MRGNSVIYVPEIRPISRDPVIYFVPPLYDHVFDKHWHTLFYCAVFTFLLSLSVYNA